MEGAGRSSLPAGAVILPEDPEPILQRALVTVLVTAHNQEDTIEEAVEGILSQDAPFPAAILLHDDASTDRTGDLCEKLQRRYPGRIVLIRERDNQYEAGRKITTKILLPLVRSPWVAFCEGDDAWIRKDKLRQQVRWMAAHGDAVLVCSRVRVLQAGQERAEKPSIPKGRGGREESFGISQRTPLHSQASFGIRYRRLSQREVLETWEALGTQLSSFLVRTKDLRDIPERLQHHWFGDWVLLTFLSLRGSLWMGNEETTLYRIHSRKSTADRWGGPAREMENEQEAKCYLEDLSREAAEIHRPFLQQEIERLPARRRRAALLAILARDTKESREPVRYRCGNWQGPAGQNREDPNHRERAQQKIRKQAIWQETRQLTGGALRDLPGGTGKGREHVRDRCRDVRLLTATALLLAFPRLLKFREAHRRRQSQEMLGGRTGKRRQTEKTKTHQTGGNRRPCRGSEGRDGNHPARQGGKRAPRREPEG